MSEEFAKSQGFADASALRRSIMEQAVRNKQQEAADAYADALVQQVIEGMEVEIINASLTVRVRGAAGQISQLTGDDIKVVVDFSNAVAGTATYKASITFGEEFTAVGAVMGPYSVSATVKG